MPYHLIVLVAVIALASVFILVADVARGWRALAVGLLALSFFWRYGLFLQVAMGVSLSLYFTYLQARSS